MNKVFFRGVILLLFIVSMKSKAQEKHYSWNNLPVIIEPKFKNDTINIVKYGAKSDGVSLNSKAINDAISVCSANGGGVVLIPNGFWLTGPIQLKSNINLHLEKNALLLFSKNFDDYKIIEGNYEGVPSAKNESPIMGTNLLNVAITGKGVIDGNGDAWRMVGKNKLTESEWKSKIESGGLVSDDQKVWFPSEKTKKAYIEKSSTMLGAGVRLEDFEPIKDFLRPNLIVLTNCKNVLLEGVTFQNSAAWNVHPILCENLTMRNLFIKNPDYAQNGDGADVESCRNVLMENCIFDVGDDAICIKSGKDEEGRKRGMPTENMIVRNNTVYKGHGGFVIGSEMSGGARNIFVYDCTFMGTDKGLRFKTARGRGGVVENIFVKNINMVDIVSEAIYFDMYYWVKPPKENEVVVIPAVTEQTPVFRNIYLENIRCNGAKKGVYVRGIPEMPVHNIYMENLVLNTDIGVEIKDGNGIYLKNCDFRTIPGKEVVYIETSQNISFDSIKSNQSIGTMFSINGETTSNISIKNSSFPASLTKAVFNNKSNTKSMKFD